MTLFAIFKNNVHTGNERGTNGNNAIKRYIIASDLGGFIYDKVFLNQYSFKIAIDGIHFNEKFYHENNKVYLLKKIITND